MSQPNAGAPVPILAVWDDAALTVTFDRPLFDQPLNLSNWVLRLSYDQYYILEANIVGSTVVLLAELDVPNPGPDGITYRAIPPDLTGLNLAEVAAFNDFPITYA